MESDYLQPDFYHFNEDSIILVNFINANLPILSRYQIIEVGAGCGVISCELLKDKIFGSLTLVEIQISFLSVLKENLKNNNINNYSICNDSFTNDDLTEIEVDLIYFNPPYFFTNEGRSSADDQKELCRRIDRSDFLKWFSHCATYLKKGGALFFCHRLNSWKASDFGFIEIKKDTQKGASFYYWENQ